MPWLARLREGRRKYGLVRYLRRESHRLIDRHFRPVRRGHFAAALEQAGVKPGMTLCVHSSLSRFGYIEGGAETVIASILDVVGRDGTVLMPSFPTGGSAYDLLRSGAVFDVRSTPSRVGLITEAFRLRPDVQRSLHPTNPVAAWGRKALEYVVGHEESPTAYGRETPYGRLAGDPEAHVLMMETHVSSFLHHLQERVSFPGLFLDPLLAATVIDRHGRSRVVETRVMRPRTPYFVAIPSPREDAPDWALVQDYALVFPPRRDGLLREHGYTFPGYPVIWNRRAGFEQRGVLRTAWLRDGAIGLLSVQGFLETVEPEMRELVARFRPHYDPERIAALGLPYL